MKFEKTVLAVSIALALGTTSVMANPSNRGHYVGDQTSSVDATSRGTDSAAASEGSSATTDTSDNSTTISLGDIRVGDIGNDKSDRSDNSTNISRRYDINVDANGNGSAAVSNGDANVSYAVNSSVLEGAVTGGGINGIGLIRSRLSADNSIDGSFNGGAGINQTVQNTGYGSLAQQQVSFQGNVNVGR